MNDTTLLHLWESALGVPAAQRAALLAHAAGAAQPATLGASNRALLRLHRQLCGPALPLLAACPRCAAALEFTLDTAALDAGAVADSPGPGSGQEAGTEVHELALGQTVLRFRLPRNDDLLHLDAQANAQDAAQSLFQRCVLQVEVAGQEGSVGTLGPDVRQALAQAIDDLEPLASLEFQLGCAECGHSFLAPLDLGSVTFAELRHRAEQVLADVAALAHAYGWREADVLALTPMRRAAYLQLAGADAGM